MSSLGSESVSIGVSAFHHYHEFQFAMITLMVYDHAITLGEEYDLFWRGPLSLSKVLYLLIRYLTLAFSALLSGSSMNKASLLFLRCFQ
ncbi:hypothetical protein F5141DRAFT_87346 [Pisolithus sp. B1]|nr:hypothetical protein F5141DRAFT_87346 [Pisolithus sp. B1]